MKTIEIYTYAMVLGKKTGEIQSFIFPSKANFTKLKNAKLLGDYKNGQL